MKKQNIVKKNWEFSEIIELQNKQQTKSFVIYVRPNSLNVNRFGLSVGKKVGNAVVRNNIRRKIKHILDKNNKNYQNSYDCIIMAKKTCLKLKFLELEKELNNLLKKSNVVGR